MYLGRANGGLMLLLTGYSHVAQMLFSVCLSTALCPHCTVSQYSILSPHCTECLRTAFCIPITQNVSTAFCLHIVQNVSVQHSVSSLLIHREYCRTTRLQITMTLTGWGNCEMLGGRFTVWMYCEDFDHTAGVNVTEFGFNVEWQVWMCGLARLVYGVATLSICFSCGIIVQYAGCWNVHGADCDLCLSQCVHYVMSCSGTDWFMSVNFLWIETEWGAGIA